jgi:hypothetical protein
MRVCGKREREGERDRARAESSEGEVRDKQTRARKRVKRTGHHKDGENERKKMHYNQTDDYLTLYRWSSFGCWLVMVTTFSSLLPLSRCISLSLSFALHATSGLSSHTALPILLYYYPIFFSLFFFSVKKTNNGGTQCNNNLFSFIIIINIIIRILRAYGTSI